MIERQALENRVVRLLTRKYRIDINKFKTNISYEKDGCKHEKLKKRIFNWLIKNDFNVICEATFKNGGRADLLVLFPALAIEVLVSETEERFNSKNYPVETIGVKKLKEVKEKLK